MKDYLSITNQYYAHWLGIPGLTVDEPALGKICFQYSEERNHAQYGYGDPFDVYAFVQENRVVLSYGEKAKTAIAEMQSRLSRVPSAEELQAMLSDVYHKRAVHYIKYVYSGYTENPSVAARTLTMDDWPAFHMFFLTVNSADGDWIREYFEDMVKEGACAGVFEDGRLVSCTDAPGMPYMAEQVHEIGINTLPEYRKKGYAQAACAQCLQNILEKGKCPLWSTGSDNAASQRVAAKLGFVKYADVLTITFPNG